MSEDTFKRQGQKGFIKNSIVFALMCLILAVLFWITHTSAIGSNGLFVMYFILLIGLTFFALRFLVLPILFPEDNLVIENAKLFQSEDSLKDFKLKRSYVNLSFMKEKINSTVEYFKDFYYGEGGQTSNRSKTTVATIATSIPEDILGPELEIKPEPQTEMKMSKFSKQRFLKKEFAPEEELLNEFDQISRSFKDEKKNLSLDKQSISQDKKEIEESIEFQREYIESVKEEKGKIAKFLHEQKEDLTDLLLQKEKEEVQLAELAAIETRVTNSLESERGELKSLLVESQKQLAAINSKRRATVVAIRDNRNEAMRKSDLIKQVQQRRMALASIKKEKLKQLGY